jgi:cytochrome oxidase assembly protein ShyY1
VKTDAGKVLVNFGWLEDKSFRQATPEVNLPVNIDGEKVVLYAPAMNVLINESLIDNAQWPRVIQQPDIDELQSLLQQDLLPFLAYAKAPENYGLKNNFKPITMTPKKHIGYAIQWFSLSVACFVIYLLALRKKLAENNDK